MMATKFPRIRMSVPGLNHPKAPNDFVQLATRARSKKEHDRRIVVFRELVEDSQLQVIRALLDDDVTWSELIEARRRNELRGATILTAVALDRELLPAIRETIPRMGRTTATRKRYEVTLAQIENSMAAGDEGWLATSPRVRQLKGIGWEQLHTHWRQSRSAADWNHVVRLISAFLTKYLGNKHHAFAIEVRALLPRDVEEERVPDLTPALFMRIMEHSAEHVRPAFMALLLTGARDRSEYLRMDREHLMPERCAVRLPGTKTKRAKQGRVVSIDEQYWPWVDAAVPSPLRYKALRAQWIKACVAAGAGTWTDPENEKGYVGLRMHDLRHALGQWASDAGVPLDRIRDVLGHTQLSTTARYTRVTSSTQVARAAGDALRRVK